MNFIPEILYVPFCILNHSPSLSKSFFIHSLQVFLFFSYVLCGYYVTRDTDTQTHTELI